MERAVWKSGLCNWLAEAGEQFQTSELQLQGVSISSFLHLSPVPPPSTHSSRSQWLLGALLST